MLKQKFCCLICLVASYCSLSVAICHRSVSNQLNGPAPHDAPACRTTTRRSETSQSCFCVLTNNIPTMASSTPVVLVTGASRGIGLSTVQYLLQSGLSSASIPKSNVITLSRSLPSALSDLQKKNSDNLECVQGDVLDESVHEKVVKRAVERWGRLDAVVLNAGVIEFGRIADAEVGR